MILKKWILLPLLCMLAMPVPAKRKVLQEKDMSAYLLVYFNDPTHSIFFATSHDGYAFTAVNNAQPVIDGYDYRSACIWYAERLPHHTMGT